MVLNTYTYMHLHALTCTYMHLHALTCTYTALHTKMNVFACKCMYLSVIACKWMYLHVLYLFVCIRDRLNVGRLEREPEIKSTRLQVRPLPGSTEPQTEWSCCTCRQSEPAADLNISSSQRESHSIMPWVSV